LFKLTYTRIGILAAVLLVIYSLLWIGSPVTEKVSMWGTVISKGHARGANRYSVRLDDGGIVYLNPPPLGWPMIGSKVAITRKIHANGRVVYKFRDMFD
jgi:hypothetical protein